jgi:hypothetical protein
MIITERHARGMVTEFVALNKKRFDEAADKMLERIPYTVKRTRIASIASDIIEAHKDMILEGIDASRKRHGRVVVLIPGLGDDKSSRHVTFRMVNLYFDPGQIPCLEVGSFDSTITEHCLSRIFQRSHGLTGPEIMAEFREIARNLGMFLCGNTKVLNFSARSIIVPTLRGVVLGDISHDNSVLLKTFIADNDLLQARYRSFREQFLAMAAKCPKMGFLSPGGPGEIATVCMEFPGIVRRHPWILQPYQPHNAPTELACA